MGKTTTLGESWLELASGLLWAYRLEGLDLKVVQRVHPRNMEAVFEGPYIQFSFKAGNVSLLKGENRFAETIIVSPRELDPSEQFDLASDLFEAELKTRRIHNG